MRRWRSTTKPAGLPRRRRPREKPRLDAVASPTRGARQTTRWPDPDGGRATDDQDDSVPDPSDDGRTAEGGRTMSALPAALAELRTYRGKLDTIIAAIEDLVLPGSVEPVPPPHCRDAEAKGAEAGEGREGCRPAGRDDRGAVGRRSRSMAAGRVRVGDRQGLRADRGVGLRTIQDARMGQARGQAGRSEGRSEAGAMLQLQHEPAIVAVRALRSAVA